MRHLRTNPYPAIAMFALALAAVSLLLPFSPVYDAWAWVVWGRELAGFDLDTSGGPSWKPLPAIAAMPLSALGDAAPDAWLLLARAGWIAALAIAALLAWRLAGDRPHGERIAAAVIALLGLALLADVITPWQRQFTGGFSEPLLVALVLAAVERGLAGRRLTALVLGTTAALIRPEVWPFLLIYAVYIWRRRELRWAVLASLGTVALLWIAGDLLGSGDVLTGADRARANDGEALPEAFQVLGRALVLPLAALWAGAAFSLGMAIRDGDRRIVALAGAALAWILLVAVMAAGGYAGLPRFLAPAAAIWTVLGAVGIARAAGITVAALRGERGRLGLVAAGMLAVSVVALGAQAIQRAARIDDDLQVARDNSERQEALFELVESAGRERLTACGPPVISLIYEESALAWQLELPMSEIYVSRAPLEGKGAFISELDGGWTYTASCAGSAIPTGSASARITGVSGASR